MFGLFNGGTPPMGGGMNFGHINAGFANGYGDILSRIQSRLNSGPRQLGMFGGMDNGPMQNGYQTYAAQPVPNTINPAAYRAKSLLGG